MYSHTLIFFDDGNSNSPPCPHLDLPYLAVLWPWWGVSEKAIDTRN